MDPLNQQQFANGIINQTLDTLRQQDDQDGTIDLNGKISFNPQMFQVIDTYLLTRLIRTPTNLWASIVDSTLSQSQNRHWTSSPIVFQTPFDGEPVVTFGQSKPAGLTAPVGASTYTPFVCEPYVFDFTWTNGIVSGMTIGVYALTSPPSNINSHNVSWRATGTASRYSDQQTQDTWSDSYDMNEPDFLTDDSSDFENYDTGGFEE